MDRWKAVIAPNPDVLLESYALFKEWLVLEERSQGLTRLRQVNWQSGEQKEIAFDDPAYVTWLAYNPEPDTSALRYGYSSMTTPRPPTSSTWTAASAPCSSSSRWRASRPINMPASGSGSPPVTVWPCRCRWSIARTSSSKRGGCAHQSAAGLRLRLLRCQHGPGFQQRPAEPAGPRLRLRHRSHPRRRGVGAPLV